MCVYVCIYVCVCLCMYCQLNVCIKSFMHSFIHSFMYLFIHSFILYQSALRHVHTLSVCPTTCPHSISLPYDMSTLYQSALRHVHTLSVCPTTCPQPLHTVPSIASSFNLLYPHFFLMPSSSCLRLLLFRHFCPSVNSVF